MIIDTFFLLRASIPRELTATAMAVRRELISRARGAVLEASAASKAGRGTNLPPSVKSLLEQMIEYGIRDYVEEWSVTFLLRSLYHICKIFPPPTRDYRLTDLRAERSAVQLACFVRFVFWLVDSVTSTAAVHLYIRIYVS